MTIVDDSDYFFADKSRLKFSLAPLYLYLSVYLSLILYFCHKVALQAGLFLMALGSAIALRL